MVDYIYILGAGRSGTTVAALFFQLFKSTRIIGELNQLADFLLGRARCVCSTGSDTCDLREELVTAVGGLSKVESYALESRVLEAHANFLRHIYSRHVSQNDCYVAVNKEIVCRGGGKEVQVDSGKFLSRGLALHRIFGDRVGFLWVTRDPRGVVFSFGKKVQSRRSMLSACFYYSVVNLSILLAVKTVLRHRVLRLKYEDLVADPQGTLVKLSDYYQIEPADGVLSDSRSLKIPKHFIGGNRLVYGGDVALKRDEKWREQYGPIARCLIWLLCWPAAVALDYKI